MTKFNLVETRAIKCDPNVIKAQISAGVPLPTIWSWGARNWTNVNDLALAFRVNGHHHKGLVYVILNGSDLYEIYLVSIQGNIKKHITDVFCEDLGEIIDNAVELIEAYMR